MIKSVCVYCGSRYGTDGVYKQAAEALGMTLAKRNITLVYGGARVGLMGTLADAVLTHGGKVIGIIPESLVTEEVAYTDLDDLRIVGTMQERKAAMMDVSEGLIALPGGFGTLDELSEALTFGQLRMHSKPCGVLNTNGYYDALLAQVQTMVDAGFVRIEHQAMLLVDSSPEGLLRQFDAYTPPNISKAAFALSES